MKLKLNIKSLINNFVLILITALGITSMLIALPLTEKISDKTSFNLITKDNRYWSKEYLLKVNSTDEKDIEKTRDILFTRLTNFGVEKASIKNSGVSEEGFTLLKVWVNTTQNETFVKELLQNQFSITIVTRKEDVNFFDAENQYAYLFAENYDETEWTREDFRNVYITELKTTENSYSNFAIFKPWVNKQSSFTKFLTEQKGEYIGISIDGFVTPFLVPLDEQNIFALPLNITDSTQVKAMNILYNSGIIPIAIALESEQNIDVETIKLDYIKIGIALVSSLIFAYLYLFFTKQSPNKILVKSFIATALTISIYITILKLAQIPIDTFMLPILGIQSALLIKTVSENKDSTIYIELILIATLLLISLLGGGYLKTISIHMSLLVLLSKFSLITSGWYLDKLEKESYGNIH